MSTIICRSPRESIATSQNEAHRLTCWSYDSQYYYLKQSTEPPHRDMTVRVRIIKSYNLKSDKAHYAAIASIHASSSTWSWYGYQIFGVTTCDIDSHSPYRESSQLVSRAIWLASAALVHAYTSLLCVEEPLRDKKSLPKDKRRTLKIRSGKQWKGCFTPSLLELIGSLIPRPGFGHCISMPVRRTF